MKKFCTDCGHENAQDNRICIECGSSLVEEKQELSKTAIVPQPVKNKKPLSLKTKILSIVGILVAASLIGVYTWGTQTASADTVVTKFFEALKNEDAEAMVKQAILSNGEAMSIKEAGAFIDLYRDITSYELEDVARVEKNGKVIGIFDAHRVIIPVQKLSFDFPYDGLALSLNGELVTNAKNTDGEYIFPGISPGIHEAEFHYEGEFAEFTYPFELPAYMNSDTSAAEPIYVDLPVSSVVFGVGALDAENPEGNKIIIGDKEIPLNSDGETAEIGPLLLDGSVTAQAEVSFPWGTQLSEPVDITSNYHMLEFNGLEEEQKTALIDQLKIFSEEYVQTLGTRDSKVFTTVTKKLLSLFNEAIASMEDYDELFMGSLTEVGIDEESITILTDGKTVTVNVEFLIDGDNYHSTENPEPDETEMDVSIDFVFDKDAKKWLVNEYREAGYSVDVTPTITFEGSGKVYQKAIDTAIVEEEEAASEEHSENHYTFDERGAFVLMNEYNQMSVAAINTGDFSLVSGLVYGAGPRTEEQSDFIDYMYSKGITEEHLSTSVEKMKKLDGDYYEVTTIEKFIIHGTESSSEKTYRTVTKLLDYNGGIYIYELISTTEI